MCRPTYPLVVGLLVVILDITAGVLGFQAQGFQNSSTRVIDRIVECLEPSHPAFTHGLAALILLSIAHVITNTFSCCACMCSSSDKQKTSSCLKKLSLVSLICSWLTFVPAMVLLFDGTYPNRPSQDSCRFSHFQLLTLGGVGCFVHGVWCIGYCFCAACAIHFERGVTAAMSHQPNA